MNHPCERTDGIVASLRFGDAPPSVLEHMAGCEECRAAVVAGEWIRQFSDASRSETPSLADPRSIWTAAAFQRERAPRRSQVRLMDLLQWCAYSVAAIGPAVWFALHWPSLIHWAHSTSTGTESSGWLTASSPILWTAVALGGIMTLVTLQLVFAEE